MLNARAGARLDARLDALLDARGDARPLAVARIGIGLAGLLIVLELWGTLNRADTGRMTVPVFTWAPAVSPGPLQVWVATGSVAALALAVGYRSRWSAGLLAVLTAAALLWDQQTYSSHTVLLLLLTVFLALGDAGAAWSLDAHRRGTRPPVAYWPQFLMRTQLTAVYLFAALSKLNAVYLSGGPLRTWMHFSLPVRVTTSLAVLSILTELFLATGLWFRVTRPAAFAAGIGLHLGIVTMLNPTVPLIAFALLCVPCYPLFAVRPQAGPVAAPPDPPDPPDPRAVAPGATRLQR